MPLVIDFLKSFSWIAASSVAGLLFAFWWTKRLSGGSEARANQIYRVPLKRGQFEREMKFVRSSLVVRILFFTVLVSFGLIQFHSFSTLPTLAMMVATYVWTELWFYLTHRLMHTPRLYWVHRPHHIAQVAEPITGACFGTIETLIILGGNALPLVFFSHYLEYLSLPFFLGFLFLKDFNNFLDHMNIDLYPRDYAGTWKSKIFNSPTYHALHHARFSGNFAQSSPWLDKLFGTYFADSDWAFDQVKDGCGLTRLTERQPTATTEGSLGPCEGDPASPDDCPPTPPTVSLDDISALPASPPLRPL